MRLFVCELKKYLHPIRLILVALIWVYALFSYLPYIAGELPIPLQASTLIAEKYGTHLDADERVRLDSELLAPLKAEIDARIANCIPFQKAGVANYDEYAILRYGKTHLASMSEEEFAAMTDEECILNFGVPKPESVAMTEAEIALVELNVEDREEVESILFDCLVWQRIEDDTAYWYDNRETRANTERQYEFACVCEQMRLQYTPEIYSGNQAGEVTEYAADCLRIFVVCAVCSVMLLCSFTPAGDRIAQVEILQLPARKGKKLVRTQCAVAMLLSFGIAAVSLLACFVLLRSVIPSVLWENPMNSYQSYFTVWYFNGTLLQFVLLISLLGLLTVLGVGGICFAISVLSKSITSLFGALLPCATACFALSLFLFNLPLSCRQSLIQMHISNLLPVPMVEIPILVLVFIIGLCACLLAVKKREMTYENA